jgi:hypothetical protein
VSELPAEDHASIPLHLPFKGKLCAGKQTHRHFRSSTEANPRVEVWGNLVDINLSPTFAGRDAIPCRL